MNEYNIKHLLFSFFIFSSIAFSQTPLPCGNSNGSNNITSQNLSAPNPLINTNECITIKLFFHFVREDDGTMAPGDPEIPSIVNYIDDRLNELHQAYPSNISFIDIGYDYIDNSNFNSNFDENGQGSPSYVAAELFATYANSPNAIDVFYVSDVTYTYQNQMGEDKIAELGGVASGIQSLACAASYSQTAFRPNIIRHEIGHCLNLFHTWHGQPNSGGGIPEDPNNCENTGDYICDTPVDEGLYGINSNNTFTNYVDVNCNYTGPQSPPPATDNVMSYIIGLTQMQNCLTNLTQGQIDRIFHPDNLTFLSSVYSNNFDLAMKDNDADYFSEPNYTTSDYDNSPDLWVRRSNLGNQELHQNPIVDHPFYGNPTVKIRITNDGCAPNTGNEAVSVFWTNASSWTGWPDSWNGPNPSIGAEIGTINIPIIQPGETQILSMTWPLSNMPHVPSGSQINSCLLARIEGGIIDPIAEYEGIYTHNLWIRNNNVVLRNLTIIDYSDMAVDSGGEDGFILAFDIYNLMEESSGFDFDIVTDQTLLNEAEVYFELPQKIFSQWLNSGGSPGAISHPRIGNAILIQNPNVTLFGISLEAKERLSVKPGINFLRSEVINDNFTLRFSQRHKGNPEILGSEHYEIRRVEREMFEAKSGENITVLQGESIDLLAEDIGENATYNWYDSNGNLLFTGQNITLTAEQTEQLKLEVITDNDKYIDYDQKSILVTSGIIRSITPQPITNQADIVVELSENTSNATLMIFSSVNQPIDNFFITNTGESSLNIDFSGYNSGSYQAILVIDGIIVDLQPFIKQ